MSTNPKEEKKTEIEKPREKPKTLKGADTKNS